MQQVTTKSSWPHIACSHCLNTPTEFKCGVVEQFLTTAVYLKLRIVNIQVQESLLSVFITAFIETVNNSFWCAAQHKSNDCDK